MDLNSLIYFAEAAKDLNFTQTAKRLFISQQNLSSQIARLEEHYGVKLFERRPRLSLTYAGEVLLAHANQMRISEDNLKNVLADIKEKERGSLRIGCSPSRSSIVMPILAEQFACQYPNVELHFHHYHSNILTKMLLDGELDFAVCIDKVSHPSLVSRKLFTDRIYLMAADALLRRHYPDSADELISRSRQGAHIRDFMQLPFSNTHSSNVTADFFQSENCHPKFTITSNYSQFFLPFYFQNAAASIITKTVYLSVRPFLAEDIHVFPLITGPSFHITDISFTRHKRKYLSQYGQHFLKIAEAYFQQLEACPD